jgi:hypothetical protein
MPLLGSHPKLADLFQRKFALDVLRQGMSLCDIHEDMVPATITTAYLAS